MSGADTARSWHNPGGSARSTRRATSIAPIRGYASGAPEIDQVLHGLRAYLHMSAATAKTHVGRLLGVASRNQSRDEPGQGRLLRRLRKPS